MEIYLQKGEEILLRKNSANLLLVSKLENVETFTMEIKKCERGYIGVYCLEKDLRLLDMSTEEGKEILVRHTTIIPDDLEEEVEVEQIILESPYFTSFHGTFREEKIILFINRIKDMIILVDIEKK